MSLFTAEGLEYECLGNPSSPSLVFIHGGLCSRKFWREQRCLSDRYHLVFPDLPGHGNSTEATFAADMEGHAEAITWILENIEPEHSILVGHSLGGQVALAVAHHSKRVQGVITVDSLEDLNEFGANELTRWLTLLPLKLARRWFTRRVVHNVMFPEDEDAEIAEWVIAEMRSVPRAVAIKTTASFIAFDYDRHIPNIACPITNLATVTALSPELEPHVNSVTVPGKTHFPMLETPERFNEILHATLDTMPCRS